jgi:triosephosphate isomerase (TIM)
MRKTLIAGNWKMNNTISESLKFYAAFQSELKAAGSIDIMIAPPFTALYAFGEAISDSEVALGSQDIFWEDSGAYTAEISGTFLKEVGCEYTIIGHSERRQYFGETNEMVNKRLAAALRHDFVPILCVGETLEQRESNDTWNIIESQLREGLKGIDVAGARDFVVAYEPVWAIGTGKTATPDQAQEVHGLIRNYLNEAYGVEVGEKLRILYGGSVKPDNSREIIGKKDIDGALVGGAALKPKDFADIIHNSH